MSYHLVLNVAKVIHWNCCFIVASCRFNDNTKLIIAAVHAFGSSLAQTSICQGKDASRTCGNASSKFQAGWSKN
jgi:hypothetical protein